MRAMALKWTARITKAVILLGGCTLAFIYLDPARGTVDANERVKNIVASASVTQVSRPLELTHAEVTSVESLSMAERLRVSGELQPVNRVVMRAKAGGKILKLAVREGERVRAGEVLMRFETDDLQSTLLQRESDRDAAEAELVLAKQVLSRIEQLSAINVTSKEQLEKAKSGVTSNTSKVQSLSAQVDIARVALRDADVLAPIDGIVASRTVEAGSRVSAAGQSSELTIDGLEGQTILGEVARINPVADNGTRFVPVYLRLPNRDGKLWGGMFATGSILVREKAGALVVPAISLRKDETGDYVLKLQNGHLQRQPVTVGQAWDGGSLVEIADGLVDGDTIVTAPLPELRPDVAVTVNKAG
jgi:multidrug efflux pump subunit AcrA (membrane-fusion protein)